MSERDNDYSSHPAWTRLDAFESALDGSEKHVVDATVSAVEIQERLRAAARFVRSVLDRSDPVLVPLANLTAIDGAIQQVVQEVSNFTSNRNEQHLVNASSLVDAVLTQVVGLPIIATTADVGNLREDIASFRKSAAAYLRGVEADAKRLEASLVESNTNASELSTDIQAQKGRLDQAIAQFQQQTADVVANAQLQATEVVSQAQQQFASAQDRRSTEFEEQLKERLAALEAAKEEAEEELEDLLAKAKQDADTTRVATDSEAKVLIEALEDQLVEAKKIVNLVGNVGLTGDYQRHAEEQRKQANGWRWASLLLFVGAATAVAFLLGFAAPDDLGVAQTVRRVTLAAILLTPAYFAARWSRDHRKREGDYRSMELELATMDPYVALLPTEYQEAIKTELASRYFGGTDRTAAPLEIDSRMDRLRSLRKGTDEEAASGQ